MTPQEQELVEELFDRLVKLENSPRDPAAERVIADGLRRAPQAAYALVQTALVQDEALKRANARIEELQAQLGGDERNATAGKFPRQYARRRSRQTRPAKLCANGALQGQSPSTTAPPYQRQGVSAADDPNAMGGHLRFGRFVSRHGRINGSGRDRRRAPAQQHPFDVRPACRPWRTGAERVGKFQRQRLRIRLRGSGTRTKTKTKTKTRTTWTKTKIKTRTTRTNETNTVLDQRGSGAAQYAALTKRPRYWSFASIRLWHDDPLGGAGVRPIQGFLARMTALVRRVRSTTSALLWRV